MRPPDEPAMAKQGRPNRRSKKFDGDLNAVDSSKVRRRKERASSTFPSTGQVKAPSACPSNAATYADSETDNDQNENSHESSESQSQSNEAKESESDSEDDIQPRGRIKKRAISSSDSSSQENEEDFVKSVVKKVVWKIRKYNIEKKINAVQEVLRAVSTFTIYKPNKRFSFEICVSTKLPIHYFLHFD